MDVASASNRCAHTLTGQDPQARSLFLGALLKLHDWFEAMRNMDPAVGCGNFIIITYREMRDFELRLLERLRELRGEATAYTLDETWDLKVSPDQFGGIEINWWPAKTAETAETAETAMFLVDHQANQRMAESLGAAPERRPITLAPKIVHADALTSDWVDLFAPSPNVYVFGNPPFLGKKVRTAAQRDTMDRVWSKNGKYSKQMDFVTSWFAAAMSYFQDPRAQGSGHFAFGATNSITQGEPVESFFGTMRRLVWHIRFAYRNFAWTTGAAAVHCVIISCDRNPSGPRRIFTATASGDREEWVQEISPYLTEGAQIQGRVAAERRRESPARRRSSRRGHP
ncbi:DNA methyltransferase [Curtobacterium flaccumfaciens]|uniref:DNA methyltransferase n=1 Tax=Curtobacterium flaccumfaciens TaxID=2035 RepID=UPI003B003002